MKNNAEVIGSIIYHERKKRRMTQEELAHQICSITYISKLENGKLQINNDIVNLLFERLGIKIDNINKQQLILERQINEISNLINQKEYVPETLVSKFMKKKVIYNPELQQYYELMKYRYYLYCYDLKGASKILNKFQKHNYKFMGKNLGYYNFFKGIHEYLTTNYSAALECLNQSVLIFNDLQILETDVYFFISMVYYHCNKYLLSINNIENALQSYNKELNTNRILDCYLLLSSNYLRLKQYELALEKGKRAFTLAKKLNNKQIIASALYNCGLAYSYQKDYYLALEELSSSFGYINDNNFLMKTNTLLEMASICKKLGKVNEALEKLNIASLYNDNLPSQLRDRIKFNKYLLLGKNDELIKFIEEVALPNSLLSKDNENICTYYLHLGDLYYKKHFYKKSSKYYKLAFEISRTFQ